MPAANYPGRIRSREWIAGAEQALQKFRVYYFKPLVKAEGFKDLTVQMRIQRVE